MIDELKRMNKGFMRKDGKFFLPITHESLVVDNDGNKISQKYVTKAIMEANYATKNYVDDAIMKAQIPGGAEIDFSRFATIEQLSYKADVDHVHDDLYVKLEEGKALVPVEDIEKLSKLDELQNYDDTEIREALILKADATHDHDDVYASKEYQHSHENKAVLDGISLDKVFEWDNKSEFSGKYEDLENKPEIPSIEGLATQEFVADRIAEIDLPVVDVDKLYVDTQLDTKAPRKHDHSYNDLKDKPIIPSIEGLATEQFVRDEIANAQLGGDDVDIDLTGYAKLTDLEGKVDKVEGKSLIDDSELVRLSELENYDDSVVVSRLEALEEIDHSAFLTEVPDEYVTDDELQAKGFLTSQNLEGLATKEDLADKVDAVEGKSLVDDAEIERLAQVDNYDDSALDARVQALEEIDHDAYLKQEDISNLATKEEIPLVPNFTYQINMVASDQAPSVITTGTYPNLIITFNIPQGVGGTVTPPEDEEPEVGVPRMWIGCMAFDESGTWGVNDPAQITEAMTIDDINICVGSRLLKEVPVEPVRKYNVGDTSIATQGGFYCCIYPKATNYEVYFVNELNNDLIPMEDLDDGVWQLKQVATELTNKIGGITYCVTGAYGNSLGNNFYMAVVEPGTK